MRGTQGRGAEEGAEAAEEAEKGAEERWRRRWKGMRGKLGVRCKKKKYKKLELGCQYKERIRTTSLPRKKNQLVRRQM